MLAVTRRALLSVLPVARRRPLPARHLRVSSRWLHITSRVLQTDPDGSPKVVDMPSDSAAKNIDIREDSHPGEGEDLLTTGRDGESGESTFKPEALVEDLTTGGGTENPTDRPQRARGRPAGSKSRRVVTKTMPQIPKPDVPQWFLDHGVTLREDSIMDPANRKIGIAPVRPTTTETQQDSPDEKAVVESGDELAPEESLKEKAAMTSRDESAPENSPEEKAVVTSGDELAPENSLEEKVVTKSGVELVSEKSPEEEVVAIAGDKLTTEESPEEEVLSEDIKQQLADLEEEKKHRYWLDEPVWNEIQTHVQAGLMLPKAPFLNSFAAMKSNCLLHFPKEGGIYCLDAVVESVAADVGADLVRIDVQDLEEIAGDFLGDSAQLSSTGFSSFSIRSLGYDAQLTSSLSKEMEEPEENEEENEEEDLEEEEEEVEQENPFAGQPPRSFQAQFLSSLPAPLQQLLLSGGLAGATVIPISTLGGNLQFPNKPQPENTNEQKMHSLLEALIAAAHTKRAAKCSTSSTLDPTSSEPIKLESPSKTGRTIIHIRDYREMERTSSGDALLRMIHDIVQQRRGEGESIIILGTTSTEETSENLTKSGVRIIQSQPEDSYERTILVPPHKSNVVSDVFKCDKEARIREVNIRHLRDVIRRRSGDTGQAITLTVPTDWHLRSGEDEVTIPGIVDTIWNFDRVHRVVTTVLGQHVGKGGEIGIEDIKQAVNLLDNSDATKFSWASDERTRQKVAKELEEWEEESNSMEHSNGVFKKTKPKLPKNCTPHEKRLLGGVINPENIHTGFSSVRAAEDTIEALKTLTSMSLIRPEAFKYGVLATDRIPGVLLYGPPGTGKTLLAKAVAKESGATVLEVSGSEIFDMYVGEGEKNVKAIFSLAQKLSPCVVFIDEADAIFGSRHSNSTRTAHREIINQFLKEWADLTTTAFIMVATNRPFDLDDAVLRRLPRRILVDLPTHEDRLEILKIHLASEILAPSVSLKAITDQTNLFSGSDLKNICVSAALACVREENAAAAKAKAKKEPHQYPEKRILEDRHFAKALEEITASISDDMSSLTAIRKFDEKYGEKKGKKKKSAWGFGALDQLESQGTGRVRSD